MKPLLSGKLTNIDNLKNYAYLVSPKLDGVRALITDKGVVSRNFKLIPNKFVQDTLMKYGYPGLDGELIVGDSTSKHCFNHTTSGVMSRDGTPEFQFYVFDDYTKPWGFE